MFVSDWAVRLVGTELDLALLAELAQAPSARVERREGEYFLVSDEFARMGAADSIRKRAEYLVELINGSVRTRRPDFAPIEAQEVVAPTGARTHFRTASVTASVRTTASAVESRPDGSTVPHPVSSASQSLLHDIAAAQTSSEVEKVLRTLGRQAPSWVDLYNVLDSIEHEVGGPGALRAKGWVSASELERFTHTANNATALGEHARHGRLDWRPPAVPTSLGEARQLLNSVAVRWLDTK